MTHRPPSPLRAVAFDVIGTLFSLESQRPLLVAAGLEPHALERWFAASLRDLFALGVVGRLVPMASVLEDNLRALLAEAGLQPPPARIEMTIAGMAWLSPQPGASDALQRLRASGLKTLALSNGSRRTTEALLERAGMTGLFDAVLSIDEVGLPKPRAEVYRTAADRLAVSPAELALVACHPWDIQGAVSAGLSTGYVSRGTAFPSCFDPPLHQAPDLAGIAELLGAA